MLGDSYKNAFMAKCKMNRDPDSIVSKNWANHILFLNVSTIFDS